MAKNTKNPDVLIKIDLKNPQQKYIIVEYDIKNVTSDSITMTFPTWSPGSYLIREFQTHLEDFVAMGADGKKCRFKKLNKCQWQINTKNKTRLKIKYRIYANDLNVRGAYSDHRMVFFNAPAVFMHIDGAIDIPVRTKILTAAKWKLAVAATQRAGAFAFKNFDDLYDTPVLCAKDMVMKSARVGKTQYTFAFWGDHRTNLDHVVRDTKKIIALENAVFAKNPCQKYVFQIIFQPKNYGGLEHSYSSTNIFDGSLLAQTDQYKRFLSLLAHEHFHLWNVKRIRPRELGPFDYTKEAYTRELWMAEGITSFYDDHVLLRAGLYSTSEYLRLVAGNLTRLEGSKAAQVNSVSDSSFDAWVRFYRQNENSINTVVSYYLKGGLVMTALDLLIIDKTKGKLSLDTVMKALYKDYEGRPQQGLTRDEFFAIFKKVTGFSCERFFNDYIDDVKTVPWPKFFKTIGVDVKKVKPSKDYYLGVVFGEKDRRIVIKNVAEDGPLYRSSLQAEDEIIAMNGHRIDLLSDIEKHTQNKKITFLFARHDRVFEEEIELDEQENRQYKLSVNKKATPQQKKNMKRFLRGKAR